MCRSPSHIPGDISTGNSPRNPYGNSPKLSSVATSSTARKPPPKSSPNASQSTQESGKLGNRKASPANRQVCTRGGPISMVSGEELLEQTDFELSGPLPLIWNRT
ncbi:MAG: DUF6531 domain-containing protein, partial [Gammaproteobacteria bacterium]